MLISDNGETAKKKAIYLASQFSKEKGCAIEIIIFSNKPSFAHF